MRSAFELARDAIYTAGPKFDRAIIAGPSHIPRWRHNAQYGLPVPAKETIFIGEGGFPLWNKSIFSKIERTHKKGTPVFLIVPDFRFGNNAIELLKKPNVADLIDGYTHIDKALISEANDRYLKSYCLKTLQYWRGVFGDDLKVIQYTLAMQEVLNYGLGRYTTNNSYLHPVWDLIDFQHVFNDVPDLISIKKHEEEYGDLIIDKSLHPSLLGYYYLNEICKSLNHEQAFQTARTSVRKTFDTFLEAMPLRSSNCVLITGDSKCIETIIKTIPGEVLSLLEQKGLALCNLDCLSNVSYRPYSSVFFLSQGDPRQGALGPRVKETLAKLEYKNVSIFPWDTTGKEVISYRHKDNEIYRVLKNDSDLDLFSRYARACRSILDKDVEGELLFEAGSDCNPTPLGILYILFSAVLP